VTSKPDEEPGAGPSRRRRLTRAETERTALAIQSVGAFTIGHVLAQTGGGEPASEEIGVLPEGDDDYYDRWYELGLGSLVAGIAPAR
jgi:hypothetical protein